MQFRKEDKRSIFPENFVEMQGVKNPDGEASRDDILSEIEFLNARIPHNERHALSDDACAENYVSKNNILDLVKAGHRLPKVETPEKMLLSDKKEEAVKQIHTEDSDTNAAPYRIVNLISGSYKLPEIEDDSFFR